MNTERKKPKGRPPLNRPTQAISVRIDKDLHKKIKLYNVHHEKGIAYVINEALKCFFKNTKID